MLAEQGVRENNKDSREKEMVNSTAHCAVHHLFTLHYREKKIKGKEGSAKWMRLRIKKKRHRRGKGESREKIAMERDFGENHNQSSG